jgi:hypothetical protein
MRERMDEGQAPVATIVFNGSAVDVLVADDEMRPKFGSSVFDEIIGCQSVQTGEKPHWHGVKRELPNFAGAGEGSS